MGCGRIDSPERNAGFRGNVEGFVKAAEVVRKEEKDIVGARERNFEGKPGCSSWWVLRGRVEG